MPSRYSTASELSLSAFDTRESRRVAKYANNDRTALVFISTVNFFLTLLRIVGNGR